MKEEDRKYQTIECPNCSFEVSAEITTTIRTTDQSLNDLFDGTLNNLICHQCAQEFVFETPLVYKSEDDSFVVFYNPLLPATDWQTAEAHMLKALEISLSDLSPEDSPECRLTLNRNDFIEKIALNIAELDDKLIEYLKFHIYQQEQYNPKVHSLYYDFSRSDHEMIEFSVIDHKTGKNLQNTQTPMSMLEELKELLEDEECPVDLDELFPGLYVQVNRIFQR